jgi:3-dehydroquinate dehydratase-2
MSKVFILNGPNLNMLGRREPSIYGFDSLVDVEQMLRNAEIGDFEITQTNSETEAVELIHQLFDNKEHVDGLIINPGAWTHYSYALHDALAMLKDVATPVIEVHISNPATREEFRHTSVVSSVATGTITGLGIKGYLHAFNAIKEIRDER